MDPHKLKEAVVLLLQRHGGTGGSPSLLAQDVQAEFDRFAPASACSSILNRTPESVRAGLTSAGHSAVLPCKATCLL